MMNIISIDPSKASTGVYIKTDIEVYKSTISTNGMSENIGYRHISGIIKSSLDYYNIEVAFLEDYPYKLKESRSNTVMAEVKGIIKYALYSRNIPIILVPISTWKALCKGAFPQAGSKTVLSYS
ncbi:unnamed protein product, partial [marine sediment metagenome]